MGGVDRVYQNVGKCIMQDRFKELVVVPAAVLPYNCVQHTSHLYRALPQRKDSRKDLPATRREIAKVFHTQASAVTPMRDRREGMPRYPQTSSLIVVNIW